MRFALLIGLSFAQLSLLAGSIEGVRQSDTSTQTLSFQPEGVIQLERSFGDVEIEGWNRPEVEITTIRRVNRGEDADRVFITTVKQGEDRLKITTQHSKTRAELKYVIKAPLNARLVVHHEMGAVKVVNFTSDIEVTNRVGDIGVLISKPENFIVDAKTRVGDLSSVTGSSKHEHVAGQQLRNGFISGQAAHHPQIFLRVGVGDITIRRIIW